MINPVEYVILIFPRHLPHALGKHRSIRMKTLFVIERAGRLAMIRGPDFAVFAVGAAIVRLDGRHGWARPNNKFSHNQI